MWWVLLCHLALPKHPTPHSHYFFTLLAFLDILMSPQSLHCNVLGRSPHKHCFGCTWTTHEILQSEVVQNTKTARIQRHQSWMMEHEKQDCAACDILAINSRFFYCFPGLGLSVASMCHLPTGPALHLEKMVHRWSATPFPRATCQPVCTTRRIVWEVRQILQ